MPAWLQSTLRILPFSYELFFPVSIFLEKATGARLWSGLVIRTGWLLITWLVARAMLHADAASATTRPWGGEGELLD